MRQTTGIVFIIVLLLNTLALRAENIIVTSRLDRGPGTLWDAIERANANGTATRDYIRFNLPGTTMDDRTIILDKLELPALSSNIEIDATTQPGTPFGISNAKVRILKTSLVGAGFFHMLKIYSASDVAIYGFYMEFRTNEPGAFNISLFNSSNVTIGGPGKGNVLIAAGGTIGSDVVTPGNSNGIRISHNIIGLEPDGVTLASLPATVPRMILWAAGEVEVDHNQICASVLIEEYNLPVTGTRSYRVHDNLWSSDPTGTIRKGSGYLVVRCQSWPGKNDAVIDIRNNHFLDGVLELYGGGGEIKVQGNRINTDITGAVRMSRPSVPTLVIRNTDGRSLVGGDLPAEKNYIAAGTYCVDAPYDQNITITKNSIFCPAVRGIQSKETVFIESFNGTTITGSSEPEALIELFEANKCEEGTECAGKTYVGSTTADAAGKWSYTGVLPASVVATGTNKQGATSEFTRATIDISNSEMVPSICGAPGSIKGIQVRGAVTVRWEDEAGNEVGNTPDLLSVPAGTYMLYASTNNDPHDDCGRSLRLTIPDTKPQVDASYASIIMPCGNSGGSITGMAVYNGYNNTFKWLNERNEVVGTGQALTNVPAGTYRLFAYSSPTCFDVSDPILLTDQQGPVIDVANMTVTPSTCMNDNGAIRNIQMGGTGDLSLRWLDENGVQVGSSANIGNLAPGTYRLEVTDESTCPALLSAPVVIGSAGAITLDVSQMKIQPAGCNNQPGNITGIQVTGADSYTWRNRSGETAGNTINLNGVPAGDYMLEAKNSYNCSAQTAWITLTNKPAASWNVKGEIRLPVCNESNGEVRITDISGAQVTNIRWTDAATNATLGTGRTLPGIGPGDYKLYLTDPDGCEQEVYTASIPVRTAPVLAGPPQITDETCGRSDGAILMPGVNGSGPFLVGWTDNTGALVGIEPELKDVKAGSYFVEAMDMYGCTVRSEAYIVENVAAPLDPPADQSLAIGKGLPLNINVTAPYPATFTLYADEAAAFPLQQNTTGVFAMPPLQQDANYFVTLSADICKSPPAKITVKAVDKITVGIPTAFTPNGDGLNDIFRPQYAMMASLELFSVYSRWGNEVFTTKTMGIGWNGRMNGTDLPAGSYIFIIRGKDLLGNAFQAQGSVLLIR